MESANEPHNPTPSEGHAVHGGVLENQRRLRLRNAVLPQPKNSGLCKSIRVLLSGNVLMITADAGLGMSLPFRSGVIVEQGAANLTLDRLDADSRTRWH